VVAAGDAVKKTPSWASRYAASMGSCGGLHSVVALEDRDSQGAAPQHKLLLLSRAYATPGQHSKWPVEPLHARGAGGGVGGGGGALPDTYGLFGQVGQVHEREKGDGVPFSETVSVIDVEGAVYGVAPRPPVPCPGREVVFTGAGTLVLPGGATAALPWRDLAVREGADFAFLCGGGGGRAAPGGAAAPGGGLRRARPEPLAEPPHEGALAVQEGLEESSVPPRDWHAVRRALWVEAPLPGGGGGGGGQMAGSAIAGAGGGGARFESPRLGGDGDVRGGLTASLSEWALQHEGHSASGRSWVVLTNLGVTTLTSVRPIDQLAYMLREAAAAGVAGGGGAAGAALARSQLAPGTPAPPHPVLRSLRLRLPPREFFSMLVALECGMGSEAPGVAGTPRAAGAVELTPTVAAAARAAFKFLRGAPSPTFGQPDLECFQHLLPAAQDVAQGLLSRGTEGLLLLVGRVLRPFWSATLFVVPPLRGGALRTKRGAVVLGSRLARAARGGGGGGADPTAVVFAAPPVAGAALLALASAAAAPGAAPAPPPLAPHVVLPRFTAGEAGFFAARIEALRQFILEHYPLVAVAHGVHGGARLNRRVNDREANELIASLALSVGMGDLFPGGVRADRRVPDAEAAGAREDLIVLLVFRVLGRTLQALRAAEAIATPTHHVPEIMYGVARDIAGLAVPRPGGGGGGGGGAPPPGPGGGGGGSLHSARAPHLGGGAPAAVAAPAATWPAAPQVQAHATWLHETLGAKFSDLVAEPRRGSTVVEGIFSRVFALLAEASEGGDGGGGGGVLAAEPVAMLAALLREHCPDFFSESTRLRATALEHLKRANSYGTSSQERTLLVERALALAERSVAESAPDALIHSWPPPPPAPAVYAEEPPLRAIVGHLNDLGAFVGSARLLLRAAAAAEGGEERVRVLNSRQARCAVQHAFGVGDAAGGDPAAANARSPSLIFRALCYRELCNTLDKVREQGAAAGGGGGGDDGALGVAELAAPTANAQFRALLGEVLNQPDAVMHEVVYEHLLWLHDNFPHTGARDELLRLETPYIENFLKRLSTDPQAQAPLHGRPDSQVLKEFYMARGQHDRAWRPRPAVDCRARSHQRLTSHPHTRTPTPAARTQTQTYAHAPQSAPRSCFPSRSMRASR
jgi:hypothetical protein